LSINFEGVYGNKIFNNTKNIIGRKGNINQSLNVIPDAINTPESIGNPNRFSDKFIEDGSFFRLSNLTIGVNIPTANIDWLKGLRIYVTGTNLFLITNYSGYDPDVNTDASYNDIQSMGIDYTNYPKARTFMAGLNVTF
jgi:iron complex outermembrane receptor protein